MKFFIEKLQHLKKLNVYIHCNPQQPPEIKVTSQEILLFNKDINALVQSLSDTFDDDEERKLAIHMKTSIVDGQVQSVYMYPIYVFDCEVDAEGASISNIGVDNITISIPIDKDVVAVKSNLEDSDSFPQSFELDAYNVKYGVFTRCCNSLCSLLPCISPHLPNNNQDKFVSSSSSSNIISRVFPLPSAYWQELADTWFCHNKKAAVITADKHGVEAASGLMLVGEVFILIHFNDIKNILNIKHDNCDMVNNMNDDDENNNNYKCLLNITNLPTPLSSKNVTNKVEFLPYESTAPSLSLATSASDQNQKLSKTSQSLLESISNAPQQLQDLVKLTTALPVRRFFPLVCKCNNIIGEIDLHIAEVDENLMISDFQLNDANNINTLIEKLTLNVKAVPTGSVRLFKHAITTVTPYKIIKESRVLGGLKSLSLPNSYNIYHPYTFERFVISALLTAAHAHVSYRFLITELTDSSFTQQSTQQPSSISLQVVLLNWDVYIRGNSIPLMPLLINDSSPAIKDVDSTENDILPHPTIKSPECKDPTPIPDSTTLLPAVKLQFKPATTEQMVRESQGWSQVFGAQNLKWPVSMINALIELLQKRQSLLPESLATLGMMKGFTLSYLVRMSTYPCE